MLTSKGNDVVRIYFFFESGINERRLALDLNHGAAFANTSKPLRPHVIYLYYSQEFRSVNFSHPQPYRVWVSLAVPLPVGVLSLVVQLADWLTLRVEASPVKLKALVLIQVAEVR